MSKTVLISVSDKSGLSDIAAFMKAGDFRVVSTGGTARELRQLGVDVQDVSEWTGFPECMDGRVKTLHPKVHMGLLGRPEVSEDKSLIDEYGIAFFDIVIVNLYPFEHGVTSLLDEKKQIELIDIGGPSMIRSAAKSFNRITVVTDPSDYSQLLECEFDPSTDVRKKLAAKAFYHVSSYDAMIGRYLDSQLGPFHSLGGEQVLELRYGENPHQKATWYRERGALLGLHTATKIQGKDLSYNNLLDFDAATKCLQIVQQGRPCCVSVKHNNPCGVAEANTIEEAVERSLKADPVSVFGGIVALNRPLSKQVAKLLNDIFLEVVVAPSVEPDAKSVLEKKKNLRVLEWGDLCNREQNQYSVRSIQGGYLVQTSDCVDSWSDQWVCHGEQPTDELINDLSFVWRLCATLKSNAIAIGKNGQSLGLGMGQVNRVDAVKQALSRMTDYHGNVQGSILASDAFFPFRDSIDLMREFGIKWVVQPGGSVRDKEVIEAARESNINMVFTGKRHFSH